MPFNTGWPMRLHFSHKLALIMTLLVIAASCIVGYTMVYRQFMMMEKQFEDTGSMLASQLSAGSVELVFTEDRLSLLSLVNSLTEKEGVESAAIINREGGVLAEAGLPVSVPDSAEIDSDGKSGNFSRDNSSITWFYSPVVFRDVSGATAWVALDRSDYTEARNAMIRSGIIVVALLIFAVALVAIRLGRVLGRPISELIRGARAIESGDFGFRIQGEYGGEFGKLFRAFNSMAEGLEHKIRVERLFSRFVSNPVAARYLARANHEVQREGKRVEASIIFVDLAGYTSLSHSRKPEEIAEVLNLYFTEFANLCHNCGGNVDKYIGDCVMMIFGCPRPDQDHRINAMQCAIRIRQRVKELNRERSGAGLPCMNIRIGISGGMVLAGLLGSHDRLQYTVIGEPANLAARLCDHAPEGGILTDTEFYEKAGRARLLPACEASSIKVKGFDSPVRTVVVKDWAPFFDSASQGACELSQGLGN